MIECRLTGGDPDERNPVPLALSDEEPKPGDLVLVNSRKVGFSFIIGRFLARLGNEVQIRLPSGNILRQNLHEGDAVRTIRHYGLD